MDLTKSNVFILGAGASMDYGFPSGKELIEYIYTLLNGNVIYGENKVLTILAHLLKSLDKNGNEKNNNGKKDPKDIIDDFSKRLSLSGPKSIDDFLAQYPDYSLLGKLCILIIISIFEDRHDDFFFKKIDKLRIECDDRWQTIGQRTLKLIRSKYSFYESKEGWYQTFWEILYSEILKMPGKDDNEKIGKAFENLKIITFNYERSIEWFLYNRLIYF
ncbi:hypothetical protein ACFLZV_02905, partial [Candidatus Margulisiibacteriota bacterium]